VGKGASVRARGRVWPRRRLDARRYPLTFSVPPRRRVRDSFQRAKRRSRKRRFSRRVGDRRVGFSVCLFPAIGAPRAAALPRCGGGIRAATVRPRTRLSRRGLRAFTERDGQESQRKTPPGCVSPALVAEPRPAPRAIRRFLGTAAAGADSRETMRRRRARRRANSLNDAFVIKRGRGRSRDVASRRRSRARLGDCLSRPRRERVTMSAPRRPSRRRRSPPPLFPSSQIRRQVLLPGEGAGLPLARVVQARATEPQV
jgi:hypothetical protein